MITHTPGCLCSRSAHSLGKPAARLPVGTTGTTSQCRERSWAATRGRKCSRSHTTVIRVTDAEYGQDLSVAEDSYVVLVRPSSV